MPITLYGASALTIGANSGLVLNRDVTFGGPVAANALIFSGPVTLSTAVSNTRTITVTSPNVTTQLNGVISGGPAAGTVALIKAGDGILQIGAAATYTGDTQIAAGKLILGIAGALAFGDRTSASARPASSTPTPRRRRSRR